MMRKVIIDTDPGTDDAIAIIAASRFKDFEILGITTVAGNKGINITTANALKLVKLCKLNCQVYQGAETSLLDQSYLMDLSDDSSHGADGLGGKVKLDYDLKDLSKKHAVDFILETVKANPYEVELLVIGPTTNIALAIQKDKETMKKVKAIFSMGGGVHSGNMNPVAEFNYWFDGLSTKIMFDLGEFVDIHMVGLNVTKKAYFSANDFWFVKHVGGNIGKIIFDIQTAVMKYSGLEEEGIIGNIIHDLLTAMYMMDHSILETVRANVIVATEGFIGQTVVDERIENKNAIVAMDVDIRKYKETFMDLMFGKEIGNIYKKYVIS